MRVSARRGQNRAEERVAASITNTCANFGSGRLVDGQGQGDDTVASVDGLQGMSVGSRRGEGCAEEVVTVAVTDRRLNRSVIDGIDGQMQCHYGVDAAGCCECLYVVTGGRVNGTVPGVAVTCSGFNNLSDCVGNFITADIHRAAQTRIAEEVEVADCRCGIARVNASGSGLQLEIPVGKVDEAHVEFGGVVAVVVVGEVEVARAGKSTLCGAVGEGRGIP